jgi:hypothetical protein
MTVQSAIDDGSQNFLADRSVFRSNLFEIERGGVLHSSQIRMLGLSVKDLIINIT